VAEAVRMVIWDLDETFWEGTLTEGGITYNEYLHGTVVELARRGIISSICSKNEFSSVKEILQNAGIWEFFVFPSISWDKKGPRIRRIVEQAQLRPETVLFLDDNPQNLAEALHYVPGIQTGSEIDARTLLQNPLLTGKDDAALTRLKQYRLLQMKYEDASLVSDDLEFLRKSGIRIKIEHNLEGQLDRIIEIINRTNQLNFTKRRLPEDPEAARTELAQLLSQHWIQAGIISVSDNYGDYGYVGFYAYSNVPVGAHLVHFCFSCRILNMGVEQWVYDRIGRPTLHIAGDVLTDLKSDFVVPDWITLSDQKGGDQFVSKPTLMGAVARGGCDLTALSHYFQPMVKEVIGEFAMVREGIEYRTDHSILTWSASQRLSSENRRIFESVGYNDNELSSGLFKPMGPNSIRLISFLSDAYIPLYRHRKSGQLVPIPGLLNGTDPASHQLSDLLAAEFEFESEHLSNKTYFQSTLNNILHAIPDGQVFLIEPNADSVINGVSQGVIQPVQTLNTWTNEVISLHGNVRTISVRSFVERPDELISANHFSRMVYYRLFKWLLDQ